MSWLAKIKNKIELLYLGISPKFYFNNSGKKDKEAGDGGVHL